MRRLTSRPRRLLAALFAPASLALLASVGAAAALSACRTPRRTVRVGNDAATLKVTMVNLDPNDAKDPTTTDFVYELSGCTTELNGALEAANVVSFSSVGLKKGIAGCQFRVRKLETPAGIKFAEGAEGNAFYVAKDLLVTQDATGALTATAGLQKLYSVAATGSAFTLSIPVKFPAAEAGKPITGQIVCSPAEIQVVGLYTATTPLEGQFTFTAPSSERADYACTQFYVHVNGSRNVYAATFASGGYKFTAGPGDAPVATETLALKLQATPADPNAPVQVDVSTSEDCAVAGKVFDAKKKTCVTAPAP